ncbi:Dehydrogenases with different specificities (related to short-chain alcohol dehydrogenases) [Phaffia rhodozyma]|uniref:Dehydrogenases with different specificities (Related to short-chain alcohol dehydrogenases) n=1 Tax=Phaffia rhodozyma TaxID=264483 RepID=A0A0F7SMK1_PHARH|nr:Dehydrogenases with different specificities (related to short-chain alcohol dehydrogenases) [Phaffia rhodozyma]
MSIYLKFALQQIYPAAPTWSVDEIPDLTGKLAAVTGGYSGIGYETVKALLNKNATVYILGRSESKARDAIDRLNSEISPSSTGQIHFVLVDLADLKSIRKGAEELMSKIDHLDILFNNGGVMLPPSGSVTTHGHDLQFGTNCLGHYHLTTILIPTLLSSPNKKEGFPRVVNTSSCAHLFGYRGGIDWGSLKVDEQTGNFKSPRFPATLYAQSKLGNVIFSNELNSRYSDQGLISMACHPGCLNSDLGRNTYSIVWKVMSWTMMYPSAMGALTQLWGGTSPEGKDLGGKYLIPWAKVGDASPCATDETLGRDLWQWFESQTEGY